ncbi:peptidase inhibitor family I36 protein [Streptomyces monticola]|uniref:Peptidase inhibitor family I36 protein n=1 Tax=Streptomyces monticola TaxID=2666263 RepID=A0ABW2JBY8_9ACTN
MRLRTRLAISVAALAVTATGVATAPAYADALPIDEPTITVGTLTPEEEAQVHAELDGAPKVDMYYNGGKVDPAADDLSGAQVCTEVSVDGTMECFDTVEESNQYLAAHAPTVASRESAAEMAASEDTVGTLAYRDCPANYVCLWQDASYKGRRLQWPTYDEWKTRHLDQYSPSFRDKASSVYVNRQSRGIYLYDFRSGLPDPKMLVPGGYSIISNFRNVDYPYGGTWNDRADAIKF